MSSDVHSLQDDLTELDAAQPAVTVSELTKTYRIYRRPYDRLVQWIADRRGVERVYAMVVEAVKDVSFTIARGETIVILGRNGSGKSTTLQMIAGTLQPTSGSIEVSGRVSALLELGAGFNPDYTGRENLRLNASIFGLEPDEIDRAEPAIEAFADIGAFIDEPVRTYSSGMYVRLAFATAIHLVPDVLIVDEALAVGDVFFQQKCMDHIVNAMQDATKLIVTHDVATAARLADRVLVMERGRLEFDGPPLEGIEYYTSLNLRDRALGPQLQVVEVEDAGPGPGGPRSAETVPEEAVTALVEDRSSNPDVLLFESVSLGVGPPEARSWQIRPALRPGHALTVACTVDVRAAIDQPILGYLVRDRVGNVIFGQNTAGSGARLAPMRPGRYRIELTFTWPEVAEGTYTLTVGVGAGEHALHHYIVCWAQNIASIDSTPTRPVHGMFNADITDVAVSGVDG